MLLAGAQVDLSRHPNDCRGVGEAAFSVLGKGPALLVAKTVLILAQLLLKPDLGLEPCGMYHGLHFRIWQ